MTLTPVLMVDRIEPSLPFWTERMGFSKVAEVPEGDSLGFVMLVRDSATLMLQTVASVRKDEPTFAPKGLDPNVGIFIDVDDFAETVKRLDGYPIAMQERTTFYGMREIGVHAPSGHPVIFAIRT